MEARNWSALKFIQDANVDIVKEDQLFFHAKDTTGTHNVIGHVQLHKQRFLSIN